MTKKTTKTAKTAKNTARPAKPTITPALINTAKGVWYNASSFVVKIANGKITETKKYGTISVRLIKARLQALLDAGWFKRIPRSGGWTRLDLTKRAYKTAFCRTS